MDKRQFFSPNDLGELHTCDFPPEAKVGDTWTCSGCQRMYQKVEPEPVVVNAGTDHEFTASSPGPLWVMINGLASQRANNGIPVGTTDSQVAAAAQDG